MDSPLSDMKKKLTATEAWIIENNKVTSLPDDSRYFVNVTYMMQDLGIKLPKDLYSIAGTRDALLNWRDRKTN